MTTLITFLGTGRYVPLRYTWQGHTYETPYVADALCQILSAMNKRVQEVCVLATQDAQTAHGENLFNTLSRHNLKYRLCPLPMGDEPGILRQQYAIFLQALQSDRQKPLIIDITHGFRAQPFFAATALATLAAAGELPEETSIVYGAAPTPPQKGDTAPIWELTPFLNRLNEAFGVITFLRTGDASLLIEALYQADANMRRRAHELGEDPAAFQALGLVAALKRFTEELRFLRVPALTIGIGKRVPSSRMLLEALSEYAKACQKEHPSLALLLDKIKDMITPLPCQTLSNEEGHKSLLHLAHLLMQWGQYAEAANVAREGLVCLYAQGPEGTDAGKAVFSDAARDLAEKCFSTPEQNRQTAGIRNTIEHCAFQKLSDQELHDQSDWSPKRGHPLKGALEALIDEFARQIEEGPILCSEQKGQRADRPSKGPQRTIFVTRHAGAREWARRQGLVVDEVVAHLEPEEVRAGDLVIGTLPVHLVAEINRRGGRYKHLTLDIPPKHRGRELSADDMEKFGAGLEEFRVVSQAVHREK